MVTFFRNLYEYRELLRALSVSYLKARYKQTALGIGWAIIPSLVLMATTLAIFPNLLTYHGSIPYPLYIFLGFWVWTLFANALSFAVPNLVQNVSLIRKVSFPREILIVAALVPSIVDFLFGFLVVIGLMIYYHVALSITILALPLLLITEFFFILGIALGLSILNVAFRDVAKLLPVALQILLFASPVVYGISQITDQWKNLIKLNPLTGIIEGVRNTIAGNTWPDWNLFIIAVITSVLCFTIGYFIFKKGEELIADII